MTDFFFSIVLSIWAFLWRLPWPSSFDLLELSRAGFRRRHQSHLIFECFVDGSEPFMKLHWSVEDSEYRVFFKLYSWTFSIFRFRRLYCPNPDIHLVKKVLFHPDLQIICNSIFVNLGRSYFCLWIIHQLTMWDFESFATLIFNSVMSFSMMWGVHFCDLYLPSSKVSEMDHIHWYWTDKALQVILLSFVSLIHGCFWAPAYHAGTFHNLPFSFVFVLRLCHIWTR